jgi:hypothetical protein
MKDKTIDVVSYELGVTESQISSKLTNLMFSTEQEQRDMSLYTSEVQTESDAVKALREQKFRIGRAIGLAKRLAEYAYLEGASDGPQRKKYKELLQCLVNVNDLANITEKRSVPQQIVGGVLFVGGMTLLTLSVVSIIFIRAFGMLGLLGLVGPIAAPVAIGALLIGLFGAWLADSKPSTGPAIYKSEIIEEMNKVEQGLNSLESEKKVVSGVASAALLINGSQPVFPQAGQQQQQGSAGQQQEAVESNSKENK